jgi:excisionase family DNA binding protein
MPMDRDELIRLAESTEWLRPHDAAAILRVHRATVDNMMRDGRLSWTRVGGRKLRSVSSRDVLALVSAESDVRHGRLRR